MDLPTLDFSQFLHGSKKQRTELSLALVESFRQHGFTRLINHGISDQDITELSVWNQKFFDLPQSSKQKIVNKPSPNPQRGWSYVGAETTSGLRKHKGTPKGALTDEKEHFDAGPINDIAFPNRWPTEDLPDFQRSMERLYEKCQQVSLQIMEACEVGLHLPPGTLVQKCMPAASEIRLNYYPPVSLQKLREGRTKRGWPHTDFGIITLLFQDAIGGLEFEDRSRPDTLIPLIRESPSEMAVNISDTFQRWTNEVIRAGMHQVTVPISMKSQVDGSLPERHSAVFFFKAHRDVSVGPLAQFVGPDQPAKYDDISALEFHRRMTDVLIR